MALGNKILLTKEFEDTTQEETTVSGVKGVRKVKPKFSPGLRFPCQI
jgi:hypothetical protein